MRKAANVELRRLGLAVATRHIGATPAAKRVDRQWLALAAGVFGVVTALLFTRAATLLNIPGYPGYHGWVLQDFRDAIYYPVVAFLAGDNPYDVQRYFGHYPVGQEFPVYSPLMLLLHLPLGLLPYEIAELLYFVLAIVLTIALAYVSLDVNQIEAKANRVLIVASLILLSRPGYANLLLGQCTLQVVLGAYAALYYGSTRPWLAALGLAVATIKPTFGLPLAVLLLCRREVRVTLVGLTVAGLASAVMTAALVHNAGGVDAFIHSLAPNYAATRGSSTVAALISWARLDAWALVERSVGQPLSAVAEIAISVGILVVGAFGVRRLSRSPDGDAARHVSNALACLVILTCVYHQTYDLLLLSATLLALVCGNPAALWTTRRWERWLLLSLLLIAFTNYAASETALRVLAITGSTRTVVVSVSGSALLVALITYAVLAVRLPAAPSRGVRTQADAGADPLPHDVELAEVVSHRTDCVTAR